MIDDKAYWIERHKKERNNYSAVGQKNYSNRSNYYIYKILKEQYVHVLNQIEFPDNKTALDAGAGIGIFSNLLYNYGFKVTSTDISKEALDKIDNKKTRKYCTSISNLDFTNEFDLVHCFDVLYHILNDDEWESSLINLCRASKSYLALHERFFKKKPIITSPHLNVRTYGQILSIINKNNLHEFISIPTHFLSLRILTYRISKFFPKLFYIIDKKSLNLLYKHNLNHYGSHFIKIFYRNS